MSLSNVWLQTVADGLIRADQVYRDRGPPDPGADRKPSRWLAGWFCRWGSAAPPGRAGGVSVLHRP
jgi:hypothetical protein